MATRLPSFMAMVRKLACWRLRLDAYKAVPPYPLDMLGAESQGMIGYVVAQEMANARPDRPIATLVTQTVVDRGDPAFSQPTKPIGPVYEPHEIEALEKEHDWTFAPDGKSMRRVVPSPRRLRLSSYPSSSASSAPTLSLCVPAAVAYPYAGNSTAGVIGVEAVIRQRLEPPLCSPND